MKYFFVNTANLPYSCWSLQAQPPDLMPFGGEYSAQSNAFANISLFTRARNIAFTYYFEEFTFTTVVTATQICPNKIKHEHQNLQRIHFTQ